MCAGATLEAAAAEAAADGLEVEGEAARAPTTTAAVAEVGSSGDVTDRFIQILSCATTGDDTAATTGPPRSSGGVGCIDEVGVEPEESKDAGGVTRGVEAGNPEDAAEEAVDEGSECRASCGMGTDTDDTAAEEARLTVADDVTVDRPVGRGGAGLGGSSNCSLQSAAKNVKYSSTMNICSLCISSGVGAGPSCGPSSCSDWLNSVCALN